MSFIPRPRIRTRSNVPKLLSSTRVPASALRIAIEYVSPATLKPSGKKLRKHSARLREHLPASLRKFGFVRSSSMPT